MKKIPILHSTKFPSVRIFQYRMYPMHQMVSRRKIESMKTFWRGVKEKMEQVAHFIPVMGIEAENGRGSVEWVKFMDSLKEMYYISVK